MNTQTADPRRGWTSASNSASDIACPGRHLAQRGLPDVESADAAFGNAVHAAIATGKDEGLDAAQLSIVESCREIEAKLMREAFGPDVSKVKVFRETRLWCMVDGKFEHSGTPDLVARLGSKGLVIEFKSLPSDIEDSPTNQQTRDQVTLAARHYLLTDVAAAIVQPLKSHSPIVAAYEPGDIDRSEREMFERVRRSNDPASPRIPSEPACKFCRARSVCKEYAAWSKSMVPAPIALFDVAVGLWTPEQCATFLEKRAVASKWIDECFAALKDRLKADPKCIPGWGLEEGDTRTKVTDVNELHARFLASGGKTENFLKCVSVVKKELSAQVRAATELKGKGLDSKLKELLQGIVEEKVNEPSIGRVK